MDSWARIVPGQNYGNDAEFSFMFWVLPATEDVWTPHNSHAALVLYAHPPRSSSSVAGGISLSMRRGMWLDAWVMKTSIAGTDAEYTLHQLHDATPKWTHIAIVVQPTEIRVYEDGEMIHDTQGRNAVSRQFVGTMDLASQLFLGGSGTGWNHGFRGSVAMLQH